VTQTSTTRIAATPSNQEVIGSAFGMKTRSVTPGFAPRVGEHAVDLPAMMGLVIEEMRHDKGFQE